MTLVTMMSPMVAMCGVPIIDPDVDGDLATVMNTSDERIWLNAPPPRRTTSHFMSVEGNRQGFGCVRGPGSIVVSTDDPDAEESPQPAFELDMGEQDFCDGSYTWDGEVLVREE